MPQGASTVAAIASALLLAGCEIDGSDNLPRVPDQGLIMLAEANWHEAETEAQIAAAVSMTGYRSTSPAAMYSRRGPQQHACF